MPDHVRHDDCGGWAGAAALPSGQLAQTGGGHTQRAGFAQQFDQHHGAAFAVCYLVDRVLAWLPDAQALDASARAIKELVGRATGR